MHACRVRAAKKACFKAPPDGTSTDADEGHPDADEGAVALGLVLVLVCFGVFFAACLWGAVQHTSAYVSIRQHASAYVSIREHT